MPLGSRLRRNRKKVKRNSNFRAIEELFKAVSKGENAKRRKVGRSASARAGKIRASTPIEKIITTRNFTAKALTKAKRARQLKRKE